MLSTLSEEDRYQRFDSLQSRMDDVWGAMRLNYDDESVVVVPSITLDRAVAGSGTMTQAMEERFLFMLMLLRQPRLRMIYVTSLPIAPEIVEYYLALLPGVIPSHARARLSLVSVNDASPRSLSEKLLDRPRALARIGALIPNRARSHLLPYNTTELERDVALSLGIPMYGADPRLADLGSKTGCRRLFGELGVPYPLGAEGPARARRHRRRDRGDARPASVHAQCDRQAQRGCLGRGQRRRTPRGPPTTGRARGEGGGAAPARGDGAGVRDDAVRRLRREVRGGRWHRRGADRGRRAAQPQRPAPRPARRRGRAALDPRPAPGRSERPEVPGLRLPRRPRVRAADHHARGHDRRPAGRAGRPRAVRGRLRRGPRGHQLDAVRDRAQPAQGRHHPPVPDAPVPDRRPLRPRRRRCSSRRTARRSTSSRPTTSSPTCCAAWCRSTSSTSSPGTGSTSTSRGRSASSST